MEISRPKTKTSGNFTLFFLGHPWKFHFVFNETLKILHAIFLIPLEIPYPQPPCLDFFWNSPFTAIQLHTLSIKNRLGVGGRYLKGKNLDYNFIGTINFCYIFNRYLILNVTKVDGPYKTDDQNPKIQPTVNSCYDSESNYKGFKSENTKWLGPL